jgi:hypothetical protein
MFKRFIKYSIPLLILLITNNSHADDTLFSTHLFEKFQAKSCTICHEFREKDKDGLKKLLVLNTQKSGLHNLGFILQGWTRRKPVKKQKKLFIRNLKVMLY